MRIVKCFLSFFIAIAIQVQATAQDLYMPRNIKAAYANQTRSMNGAPGAKYWQNKGVYDIKIKVDVDTKIVSGKETIIYSNNSSDTLLVLPIRFVNNLHKPTSPRSGQVSEDFLSEGLSISSLKINEQTYNINAKDWGTVNDVKLTKPILPGTNTSVYIEWSYPLSKQSGREGQIDEHTMYVAYSYPRISVYDDYNGWDIIPHSDRQEFYNDFNDYAFSVMVPKNYVVYATGDLLNPDEVLQPEFANRLKKSYASDEVIHIANASDMKSGRVTRQKDWNEWKFKASHIPDVCFALSSSYVWDASSVVVDKKTGRRASTQAAYDAVKGTDFIHSVKNNNFSLAWFSEYWPGIPYPYAKMTAFQGFADMEYPMMVNDAQTGNTDFAKLLQDHEVAHTYFPFYMGTNETRYAFMDEGWATTLEYLVGIAEKGKDAADRFYKNFRVSRYVHSNAGEVDLPIISMSTQVSGAGYSLNSYVKSSLSYLALKDLLGDDLFKKALHHYMNMWNGKHPIPWDFFNCHTFG